MFDLDGVITRTASLHARAWKRMFDAFLKDRSSRDGADFRPFDIATDYRALVDGKPRLDGIRAFLASRGITLPSGSESDPPTAQTVHGLGACKNAIFHQLLDSEGVEIVQPSIDFVRMLRRSGTRVALVTSSRNGPAIVQSADIGGLFEIFIDGGEAARCGLRGKPNPDTFREALRRMGARASHSLLVEDAVAGIEAGRAAGFGCIIALAARSDAPRLREAGADCVVESLAGRLEREG